VIKKEIIYKFTSVVLGIIIGLFIGEIMLRITGNFLSSDNRYILFRKQIKTMITKGSIYQTSNDPDISYELKPNSSLRDIRINSSGFRGREFSAEVPKGTVRIAFIGDSQTFESLNKEEDTLCDILEKKLNEEQIGKKFEVLNFGVEGYNTVQEHRLLNTKVLPFDPDIIFLHYNVNDPIIQNTTVVVNKALKWKIDLYILYRFLRLVIFPHYNRQLAPHRNRTGVDTYINLHNSEDFQYCKNLIIEMGDNLNTRNIRFIILIDTPTKYFDDFSDYPFNEIHEKLFSLKSDKIEVIDALDNLSLSGYKPIEFWIAPNDNHKNKLANQITAERIVRYLLKSNSEDW